MQTKLILPHRNARISAAAFLCTGLLFQMVSSVSAGQAQVVKGHVPAAVSQLQPTARLAATQQLNLAIGLPLRNQAGLTALLRDLYDPANPNYRNWLTPEEFTRGFGPTEADYQAVVDWAKSHGLTVTTTHPNRVVLDVAGTAADIEQALHITLQVYTHPTEARTFYAPNTAPTLDLAVPILDVSGLDNYALPRPNLKVKPLEKGAKPVPNAGSGPGGTYRGSDFRAAYVPGTTLTGTGQTVGLLQFDGYTPSDIAYYEAQAGLPSVTLSNVLLDGYNGVPTGSGGEVEVSLDIEMVISMAPGISRVMLYEAGPNGLWHDILNRMVTDNIAKQISCSWYIPGGGADTVADQIFQQMASQGQSFFNASGDADAYCGLIDFPGDTPYITQVGGTTLSTTGPGGSWLSEHVWNWNNDVGSGGGISTFYAIPSWQTGLSMVANHGSTTLRNTPDVALTADQVYVRADGADDNVGGTSAAAPLWAGVAALVNQRAIENGRPTVGFLNPALYTLGQGPDYSAAFHDIILGNNTNSSCGLSRFPAVTGFDLGTGWGTPAGTALIDALAGPPDVLQISPFSGFSASGGSGGPFDVSAETFTLTNAGAAAVSWTLSSTSAWLSASSTSGTLNPSGPATSVTISLNAAASNLVVGSYSATIWFTNISDGIGQSRSFNLTVLGAPVITTQPVSQSVLGGSTVTFSVGVSGLAPLHYQWRFFGTNLPTGTDQSLILTGVTTNQTGNYIAVVSNSLGSATSAVAVLTVIPPPANDQCAGAIVISASTYSNTQSTTNATSTGDPSPTCIFSLGKGVWYSFTAPNNGRIVADTIGSGFDTGLGLYVGSCGAPTQLACDDDSGGNLTSRITNTVTAGTTYLMLAGGYNDASGNLVFHFAFTSSEGPPSILTQPTPQTVAVGGSATFCVSATGTAPLSYYWSRAGTLIAGATSSCYTTNNVQLVDSGSQFSCLVSNALGTIQSSSASLTVIAGAGNDLCGNAVVVTNAAYTNIESTTTATSTGDPVPTCGSGVGHGVWYTFTPPSNGGLVVDTIGSGFDTVMALYAGTCGALTSVACDDDSGGNLTSRITNTVTGGTTYYVLAGGYGGASGNLVFHLAYTSFSGPPIIVTQPANRTIGVGGSVTFNVSATGSSPFGYFWKRNGTLIAGATSSSYTTNNVQLTDSGSLFSCLVSNALGTANSSSAMLTVTTNFSSALVAVFGAPGVTTWNSDVSSKIGGTFTFSQVDGFLAGAGQPVPTLAQLQVYGAVLVYSDASFSDAVAWGDVLADYVDSGGGVVLAAFDYASVSPGNLLGRISTGGYLPFTTGGPITGSGLTLVADLPAHPILNGVASFNGGTSGYHHPVSTTAGATLLAHWTDGQPLVATIQPTLGRIVGLNFYPPSSDARSDFWNAGTDGARLMANALLWAGQSATPQIKFTNISRDQSGQVQLTITGGVGDVYRLLVSSNLLTWASLGSISNLTGVVQFTDTTATALDHRFYRCVMP